ncbi:hypothetical protein Goarm_005011, partial [Gossypium armourianum]|nr:hypothetical protein [Gossypium armourianum]
ICSVPTLSNLVNRRVAVRSYCPVCRGAEETVEHLFHECPVAVQEPTTGITVKANFDVTFNQITKQAIVGVTIKNREGSVMAAGTYPYENVADSVVAEARVCLSAMILLEELGFREVVVEGDSLTVIRKIRAIEDGNRAAHTLAEEGRKLGEIRIWIEEVAGVVKAEAERDRTAMQL